LRGTFEDAQRLLRRWAAASTSISMARQTALASCAASLISAGLRSVFSLGFFPRGLRERREMKLQERDTMVGRSA